MTSVTIPFVRIEASQNPNVSVAANSDSAEPYLKSMAVAFASVRRWNPDAELRLVSNHAVAGDYQEVYAALGVKTILAPFDHRPPRGFAQRFTASLYLLDALDHLEENNLIIDPDVLCIKSLDSMVRDLGDHIGALKMRFPADEDINGLNRIQAGRLHGLLGEPHDAPDHYGGEVYFIKRPQLVNLLQRVENAWKLTLKQHERGGLKFTTEEHVMSYALRAFDVMDMEKFIRRIWTTHKYRTVNGKENQLTLWHLPAEKDRGFLKLFPEVLNKDSWFWTASEEDFARRAGRLMGLHGRDLPRIALDSAGWVLRLLETPIRDIARTRT